MDKESEGDVLHLMNHVKIFYTTVKILSVGRAVWCRMWRGIALDGHCRLRPPRTTTRIVFRQCHPVHGRISQSEGLDSFIELKTTPYSPIFFIMTDAYWRNISLRHLLDSKRQQWETYDESWGWYCFQWPFPRVAQATSRFHLGGSRTLCSKVKIYSSQKVWRGCKSD